MTLKIVKHIGLLIIIASLIGLGACSKKKDSSDSSSIVEAETKGAFNQLSASDMTFQWRVTQNTSLEIKVSAPTTGWVGVGFNSQGAMDGANLFIGFKSGDTFKVQDGHGVGHSFQVDTTQNTSNTTGTQSGSTLTLSWIIPLNSGDSNDTLLTKDSQTKVLLSYGTTVLSDTSFNKHSFFTSETITIK